MEREVVYRISVDDYLDCFGDFNRSDPICKKLCVLRLRCAIERDQSDRLEVLEDLIATSDISIKIQ